MQKEIWKDIIGFKSCYQVSNIGRIKSLPRRLKTSKGNFNVKGIYLKGSIGSDGYKSVTLKKAPIKKYYKVHQLVAIHFLNHKQCGYEKVVNHIDFNKLNNNVNNLEVVTPRENGNKKHIKSSSKYTGVTWVKTRNKWKSRIFINGKIVSLGSYENEYDAHVAYEKKLQSLLKTK